MFGFHRALEDRGFPNRVIGSGNTEQLRQDKNGSSVVRRGEGTCKLGDKLLHTSGGW